MHLLQSKREVQQQVVWEEDLWAPAKKIRFFIYSVYCFPSIFLLLRRHYLLLRQLINFIGTSKIYQYSNKQCRFKLKFLVVK
jgi:hypothetical protein